MPPTTPDLERLLDRVRKLLALATSPNVHEAALAASRAQALIDAHRLEGLLADEDDDPVEDHRDRPLESGRRIRKWKGVLASTLAELNGCVVYTWKAGKLEHLVVVGTAADHAAVEALWSWLVKRVEWLSATHGEGQDRAWHEAFRIGAVQTIAERLRAGQIDAVDALEAAALVRVEQGLARRQDRVDTFARERLRLKRGRGVRVDRDAFRRGRAAGREVDLPDDR